MRAWLGAHQTDAASPALRVAPPEQTGMIPPEGAERLPVPLTEEELDRVRRAGATDQVAAVEKELLSYRDSEEGRDALLHKALAAGVPAHRIVELSGVDPHGAAHTSHLTDRSRTPTRRDRSPPCDRSPQRLGMGQQRWLSQAVSSGSTPCPRCGCRRDR